VLIMLTALEANY